MPRPTQFASLKQAAEKLGLPPSNDSDPSKSASKLSLNDIAQLGWKVYSGGSSDGALVLFWEPEHKSSVYNWIETHSSQTHSETALVLDQIKLKRKFYLTRTEYRKPVSMTKKYQLPNNSLTLDDAPLTNNNTLEAKFLSVYLHYVDQASRKVKERTGRELDLIWDSKPLGETDNLAPNDFHFAIDTTTFAKERAVVSLLRLTTLDQTQPGNTSEIRVSELAVDRLVGFALSTIFVDAKCGLVKAVVAIREDQRGPSDCEPSSDVRAQIALAVHAAMILLVIAHYAELHKADPSRSIDDIQSPKPGVQTQFGEECTTYGIYYDDTELVILAHFPQLTMDRTTGATSIRFFQVPVACFDLKVGDILDRWRLVIALFAIQRHAESLVEKLEPVMNTYGLTSLEDW